VGDLSNKHRILTPYGSYESTEAKMEQILMHRVAACNFLDMNEFTFDAYIVPMVTSLRLGGELYYLAKQIENGLYSHTEASTDTDMELHLINWGGDVPY